MDTPVASLFNPINLGTFVSSLPAKIQKDERRVAMFFAAALKKEAEIAAAVAQNAKTPDSASITVDGKVINPSVDTAAQFLKDASTLVGEYIHAANPKNYSFGDYLHDPLFSARENVRKFARKWNLDAAFVEAMG